MLFQFAHCLSRSLNELPRQVTHLRIVRQRRDNTIPVLFQHTEGALEKVSQVVGEVRVDPSHQGRMGKITIQPERNLPEQEIADGIGSVLIQKHVRFHHVAHRLGHLASLDGPPAVGEHPRWRGKSLPFEHGGPVYGVGGQDVLPDEMGAVGPECSEPVIVCRISG